MNKVTSIVVIVATASAIAFGANAYAKRDGSHGDRMVNKITKTLELDDSQAEALKTLQAEIIETRSLIKGDHENMRAQVSQLLGADSFDQGAALAMINDRAEALQANAPELVASMGTFIEALNPQQKAKVQSFLDNGKRFKHGRH